jgi:hypothetical protein
MPAPTNTTIVHTVHSDAAVLTASSEYSTMLASNMQNVARSTAWRGPIDSPESAVISGTYADGGSYGAGFFGLWWHQLFGAAGRLVLYPNDDYTGTPTYDSGAFTIGEAQSVGQAWGMAAGSFEDSDLLYWEQPFGLWFPMVRHKSFRFFLSGTPRDYTGSLSYYQIGRLVLGPWYEFDRNVDFVPSLGTGTNTGFVRTAGGTNARTPGERWDTLECNMRTVSEYDSAAMVALMKWMGTGRDGVLALYPGDSGWRGRQFLLNGCFSAEATFGLDFAFGNRKLVFQSN